MSARKAAVDRLRLVAAMATAGLYDDSGATRSPRRRGRDKSGRLEARGHDQALTKETTK